MQSVGTVSCLQRAIWHPQLRRKSFGQLRASSISRPCSVEYALVDIDGVLVLGDKAIPGSAEAFAGLSSHVRALRLVTNNSQEPSARTLLKLQSLGFGLKQGQVFSALSAAKQMVNQSNLRPFCLLSEGGLEEFHDVPTHSPNAVVIGTAPQVLNYDGLTQAARVLLHDEAAKLIAVNKGRYFRANDGDFSLMAGPFVAAVEYASGRKATLVGKPNSEFFHAAAADAAGSVGPPSNLESCIMIGDDVLDDVQGAMDAGMQAILVRSGKYRPGDEAKLRSPALAVVDDLAGAFAFLQEAQLLKKTTE